MDKGKVNIYLDGKIIAQAEDFQLNPYKDSSLTMLRLLLKQAESKEDYEECAKIRDAIKDRVKSGEQETEWVEGTINVEGGFIDFNKRFEY